MANKYVTVVPAYGRDYKNKKDLAADFHAGKDFIVQDFFSGEDGRAVNKEDAERAGIVLSIRYDRLTKVVLSNSL